MSDKTKKLDQNLQDITGIHNLLLKRYQILIVAILLHDLAGEVLSCESGKLDSTELYIPKMGTLKVKFVHTKKREYEFIPDTDFDRKLLQVWRSGDSPLLELLETDVVDKINKKYNGLL